ncbi:MAG: hypothetical protein SPI30_09435 [Prevotella sp.]|nr:hypothetical protein [Prevotella sp.]
MTICYPVNAPSSNPAACFVIVPVVGSVTTKHWYSHYQPLVHSVPTTGSSLSPTSHQAVWGSVFGS